MQNVRFGWVSTAVSLAALAVLTAPAPAGAAGESSRGSGTSAHEQAVIPFVNLGGIYDWAADGERGIYIQSINRQWYYAKLFAPCINLPFAVRVGFVTEPGSGDFDRLSSILVRGEECPVASLTQSGPPPSNDHRWRSGLAAHEGAHGSSSHEASREGGASQNGAPR